MVRSSSSGQSIDLDDKSKEFRLVEGWPDKKPCIVCGIKPTHYQERAKERERSRMLCKACCHRAMTIKSIQFRTKHGVIDLSLPQKWTNDSLIPKDT